MITQIRSSAWLEHYTDNVGVSSSNLLGSTGKVRSRKVGKSERFSFGLTVLRSSGLKAGGLAQLARALALQAKGHRFDSDILHKSSLRIDNGYRPDGSKPYYQLLFADSFLATGF